MSDGKLCPRCGFYRDSKDSPCGCDLAKSDKEDKAETVRKVDKQDAKGKGVKRFG